MLGSLLQQLLNVLGEIVYKTLLRGFGIGVTPQQRRLQLRVQFQTQGLLKACVAVKTEFVDQTQHRWPADGGFLCPLGNGFQTHNGVLV